MTAGKFYRPKPSNEPDAFARASSNVPSIFATAMELGRQAMAEKRNSAEGQANIMAGKARVDALITRSKAGRR